MTELRSAMLSPNCPFKLSLPITTTTTITKTRTLSHNCHNLKKSTPNSTKRDMPKSEASDSSENSSEEVESPKKSGKGVQQNKKISGYEKQRIKRIQENRARMEALGLKRMVKSFTSSAKKGNKKSEKKGERKVGDDDEDYRPAEDEEMEEGLNSSSEEDDKDDDDDDDKEFTMSRKNKGKNKTTTPKKPLTKKRVPTRKSSGYPDYVDDEDALMQAIALSLQDSAGFLNVKIEASESSTPQVIGSSSNVNKGNTQVQEDIGKKNKKMINSRVQMTEDEVILHFFQFDEAGKGNISFRDVQRLAAAHAFMWSDKEMADMINCFDTDGDGKLSLDDFRKIVGRCNLIQVPENAVTGQMQ